MILRNSIVFVPCSECHHYLAFLRETVVPDHEQTEGLISVSISHRTMVGYCEFAILSVWQSEQAMTSFLERETPSAKQVAERDQSFVHRAPEVYELVIHRFGKRASHWSLDCCGEDKEGAD
jgi:heme-degrading monooxygenase HmoA